MVKVLLTLFVLYFFAPLSFSQSTLNSNWDERFALPGLAGNFSNPIFAVATKDSMVFIAGSFSQIDGVPVQNIAMFDGRKWIPLKGYGVDSGFVPFSLPQINALIIKDNYLIVGGNFTSAGGVHAKNIAKYNIVTGQWSPLGLGIEHQVQTFFIDGDTLYIGLNDTESDGILKYSFTGNNYLGVGGRINGSVYSIEKYNNVLYAGGTFDSAGTVKAKNIARFNGTSWSPMSWGIDIVAPYWGWAEVRAIKGTQDGIYAGGFFNAIEKPDTGFYNGIIANNIALFNPDSARWFPVYNPDLSQGVDGYIYSLKIYNNELYIGGNFLKAGADSIRRFARYNKSQGFSAVGGGLAFLTGLQDNFYGIKAMVVDGFNNLVIAGNFISAGIGKDAPQLFYVGKWSGTDFRGYGHGIAGYSVNSMAVTKETNPRVFITGENVIYAGDKFIGGFGFWDGFKWNQVRSGNIIGLPVLNSGGYGYGNAMAITDTFIYVGGRFDPSGPVTSKNVLKYNYRNNTFSGLGVGVTGIPYAVEKIAVTANGKVFISGDFTEVGGIPVSFLAVWDGSMWSGVGTINNRISSLKANGNKLYVGGEFTTINGQTFNHVAVYDAVTLTWSAIGSGASVGADYIVHDFEFSNNDVYLAGEFTQVAGVNVNHIAKYNTAVSTVTSLGNGIPGLYNNVYRINLMGSLLYVSGYFDTAGTVPATKVARWNGTRWDSLGSGILQGARCIVNDGRGNVYFAGSFDIVGDSLHSSLFARWEQSDFSGPLPSVIVTYPNGGETLVAGTLVNITWSSTSVISAKIELTTNNGTAWTIIAASVPAAAGTYSLTVPNTPSTLCKIKISDVSNSSINDLSDNTFSISNQICKNIGVSNGWNLVSVPLEASSMLVSGLFPTATSAAYGYNNGYSTATTMENSKGYWLKFNSDQNINICGSPVSSTSVSINAGWNLIGVYDKDIAVSGLTTTPAGIITSAYYGYAGGYSIPTTLLAGKGYFVKASASGVINLPTGTRAKQSTEVSTASLLKDAYELSVTDNTGNRTVLYFAGSGKDLALFNMPPVPPQGIFDVRFTGDRMVTEKGITDIINISGAVYPVTIRFEKGKGRITDLSGGKRIDKDLQEGSSVVITDSRIEKVQIKTESIPEKFSLSQNYPNPFNPSTTINYTVPLMSGYTEGAVTLKIYDMLGGEVETLVNKSQPAGNYSIVWNASNYSSGIYYYELRSGEYRSIKKMMLLK